MISRVLPSLLFLLVLVFGSPARAQDGRELQTVQDPTPAYTRDAEVAVQTRRLLSARDTAGLEALADGLRKSGESTDGGYWLLSTFYANAVDVPGNNPAREKKAMDFYETWASERPESITAQVCLAMALTSHAWNARGSGWASSVTDEGWRLFGERLDRARAVLASADGLEEKCPGWFAAAQTVALGQGWSRREYMAMMDEAIRRTPTYGQYYMSTCYWLLPRWNGEPGDFERWIAEEADKYPPDRSDLEYARFVWEADRMRMREEMVFAPGRLDWDRAHRGFLAWMRKKPENLVVLSEYARLAVLAGDRDAAAQAFRQIDGRFVPGMWNNDPNFFRATRSFALEGGANPTAAPQPRQHSHPAFSQAQIETAALIIKLTCGFLGGLVAGLLLFFLALQRRHAGAGAAALAACLILGTALGTLATVASAAGLWLWLRRKAQAVPPPLGAPSGWMVLLWVLVLTGLYMGLQIAALIPASVPYFLEHGADFTELAMRALLENGVILLLVVNSAWLAFLALLLICRPMPASGWRERLGLHPCWSVRTLGWMVAMVALVVGAALLGGHFEDARTRSASALIAEGVHSPVIFLLALVLAAPAIEELIFRGYALSGWLPKLGAAWAIALSSALFTAMHFQYGWVGLLQVAILGVALGVLRWKSGSVYPCLALHGLYNLAFAVCCFFTVK